jgi:hypothetical protein
MLNLQSLISPFVTWITCDFSERLKLKDQQHFFYFVECIYSDIIRAITSSLMRTIFILTNIWYLLLGYIQSVTTLIVGVDVTL